VPTSTILALAIGDPEQNRIITDMSHLSGAQPPRPYVIGLINYLSSNGYTIGVDYTIDYRECFEGNEDFNGENAIIFCMSTPIVRKAVAFSHSIPIVGVFSNPTAEGFDKESNVCGVNAQRIQNARHYYDRFIETIEPTLRAVYVLHRVGNTASNGCLAVLKKGGAFKVPVAILDVATAPNHDIKTLINRVPTGSGLLVLPVDLFFGSASYIFQSAQARSLPVFWPTPDGVPPAVASYGISQYDCGQLMGAQVKYILDNGGKIPQSADRFVTANNPKWVASTAVAKALNVELRKHKELLFV
jgi:ABC-type uncharacterized transport system substrate-binding protein